MPRPSNTEKRRSQIVGGLARVMAERGYAKATIQAIAAEAGLTPGLVHYHFANKQEILLALIAALGDVVRKRMDSGARSPRARLDDTVDALLGTGRGIEAEAVACWVVVGAEAVRQPEVRRLYEALMQEAIAELEAIFRDALREAGRPESRARAGAVAVVAAVEGFFRLAAGAPSCVPPGSAADTVRAIARGFLSADEADQPEEAQ
ncbi:MAG: TetR family transcriptional regulator [Myxococcota bacterium]|nr:TetR family transcriptional regulator [Myxococcota bacterium]